MRIFCSICKDIFIPYSEVQITNCGHLYHGMCISTWLKQHRTCPQCRATLSKPFRVYFDVDKDNELDPSTLEHQVETLSDKLRELERQNKNLEESKKNFEIIIEEMKECATSLCKKNDFLKTSVKALKEQVTKLSKQNEIVTQLQDEVAEWKNKVSALKKAETLIKGSVDEVNKMIESTPVTGLAVKQLCTYVGILKSQLQKIEMKNSVLVKENKFLVKEIAEEKKKCSIESEEAIIMLRTRKSDLENEILSLKKMIRIYQKKHSENKESIASSSTDACQLKAKKSSFDLDFDILNDNENNSVQSAPSQESEKRINHWEEMVCAGPSRNMSLNVKSSVLHNRISKCTNSSTIDTGVARSSSMYVFDGLGGRKKLRLGGPTPHEEFENIKRKKEQKFSSTFQHNKIIQYYQRKTTENNTTLI